MSPSGPRVSTKPSPFLVELARSAKAVEPEEMSPALPEVYAVMAGTVERIIAARRVSTLGDEPIREATVQIASVVAALGVVAHEVREATTEVLASRASVVGQLPALVGVAEAAKILGIDVEALRSRLKRGQIPKEAIRRTGGKRTAGGKGGNAGRVQFRRDVLVALKGGK